MDRKAEGVDATSADFLRYDQVDKKQRYHLAESAEDAFDEIVSTLRKVLAEDPKVISKKIRSAVTDSETEVRHDREAKPQLPAGKAAGADSQPATR